jgi:hypothetical protein
MIVDWGPWHSSGDYRRASGSVPGGFLCEIRSEAHSSRSFFGFALLITIPLLLHADLSPPSEVYDSHDQAVG